MRGNDRLLIRPFGLAALLLAENNGATVTPLLSTGTGVAGETRHYPASRPAHAHVTASLWARTPWPTRYH